MARVTSEDCLEHIQNHFELVLVASHRARQILAGSEPLQERDNDKATVLALREIAAGAVDADILNEPIEQKDAAEEELKELLANATGETLLASNEVLSELAASQPEPTEDDTAEPTLDADKHDKDVATLKALLSIGKNEEKDDKENVDDLKALLSVGQSEEKDDKGDAETVDLDTLMAEEQREEQEEDGHTMQVDDHDTIVAETAEEIEQRADLNLDSINDGETAENDASPQTDADEETRQND